MNNKILKYLAKKSANVGNWLDTNKTNIKKSSIKAIATMLALGGIASSMAGCQNTNINTNDQAHTKPSTSQSSEKVDSEPAISPKHASVVALYDNIATEIIRRTLLSEGKITEEDVVVGKFLDISPKKIY